MIGAGGDGGSGDRRGGGTSVCGGIDDGGCGGWSPSSIFVEQSLEREFTPFFLQMTGRVCWGGGGGVPSPLVELKMGREGKWPT